MTIVPRLDSALLVAVSLARSLFRRPIRLVAALAGGIGGVLLATAVFAIAVPVVLSTRVPPVDFLGHDVVTVVANAPAGIESPLATNIAAQSDASASSRVLIANTTARGTHGFSSVVLLGVDRDLPAMLVNSALSSATRDAPLGGGRVYLSRSWAQQQGFRVGDGIDVTTPTGLTRFTVAALLDNDFANHGAAIVLPINEAAQAFDRGTSVDLLLLRGGDTKAIGERAQALADGAAEVTTPDRVFGSYDRMFRTPLMLVSMFATIAVVTGAMVVFLTWRLALSDARPILSRVRLLGVRSRDLVLGTGLVLIPILLITYVIGAAAGIALGNSLDTFRSQLTTITGQAFQQPPNLLVPLIGAFIVATAMFAAAWLSGLLQLRRVSAIDALTGRDATTAAPSRTRLPLTVGVVCMAAGAILVQSGSPLSASTAVLPVCVGLVLLAAALPVVIGLAVRRSSSGATGLFVGRQLEVEWRRNAALAITFAVALVTSMTMSGTADSVRHEIDASMLRLTQGQLYIVAAPVNRNFGSETFPASVQTEIAGIGGVASTDSFAYANVAIAGGRYRVETLGGDVRRFTNLRLTDGPPDVLDGRRDLGQVLSGDDIAISSNLARTQRMTIGSTVNMPTSGGHRVARVVAVLDDSTSDGGMYVVGADLYQQVAGASRLYAVGVVLNPHASVSAVKDQIAAHLASRYPRAVVLTAQDYRGTLGSDLGRFMGSFVVFAWAMYLIAAIVGTATLASSIAERGRATALTRLVGGKSKVVRRLLGVEAMTTVVTAWLVAVPTAFLAIPAMLSLQATASGLLPPVQIPITMIAISLPMSLLAVVVALFVARRVLGERPLTASLADE